ncbi:SpaA isopeptide-forming pilin-related protein [Chakrabartyella piscis]|uniref:SpaA isopeptide-forming pilin-related protein n=1 Tax=Chakrabartyella piscis TaxID=2918914 RepID=UPI0029587EF9|nr:SpaA isopeptide-forming pilin-related protein [Chakrabartyella piscis]
MKRILSRFLVSLTLVVAVISSMIPTMAFAEETKIGSGDYSITIINEVETGITIDGDWFHAYQLLVADSLTTYAVHADFVDFFSGIKTGADNTKFYFDVALKAIEDAQVAVDAFGDDLTSMDAINALYDLQVAEDDYNQLVGQYLETFQSGDPYELVVDLRNYVQYDTENGDLIACIAHNQATSNSDGSESVKLTGLTEGYYFVLDEESTLTGVGIASSGALVPVGSDVGGDATIYVKNSVPVVDKSILHNDLGSFVYVPEDASGDDTQDGQWDIVGDYEVGDTAYFLVTSTLPNNIDSYNFDGTSTNSYDDYYYELSDTMSDGITYQKNAKVYVDRNGTTELDDDYYTVDHSGTSNGFVIQVNVKGLKADSRYTNTTTLYTHYTGVVNANAEVSKDYEENTITLSFNSNPSDSSYIGSDSVTVYSYTFDLEITKMDENGDPLAGATFGIYDGSIWIPVKYLDTEEGVDYYYLAPSMTIDSNNTGYVVTNSTGEFVIYGLDDAIEYVLKEESAPTGYNAIDPIPFIIEATYDSTTGTIVTLTDNSASIKNSGNQSGFEAEIMNRKTVLLPSTGGIGTIIFQIGGALLMLGAALYLILGMKKKSEKENQ